MDSSEAESQETSNRHNKGASWLNLGRSSGCQMVGEEAGGVKKLNMTSQISRTFLLNLQLGSD